MTTLLFFYSSLFINKCLPVNINDTDTSSNKTRNNSNVSLRKNSTVIIKPLKKQNKGEVTIKLGDFFEVNSFDIIHIFIVLVFINN